MLPWGQSADFQEGRGASLLWPPVSLPPHWGSWWLVEQQGKVLEKLPGGHSHGPSLTGGSAARAGAGVSPSCRVASTPSPSLPQTPQALLLRCPGVSGVALPHMPVPGETILGVCPRRQVPHKWNGAESAWAYGRFVEQSRPTHSTSS